MDVLLACMSMHHVCTMYVKESTGSSRTGLTDGIVGLDLHPVCLGPSSSCAPLPGQPCNKQPPDASRVLAGSCFYGSALFVYCGRPHSLEL